MAIKTYEPEHMFGEGYILSEENIEFLDQEPLEDFIPNKINGAVSGFLVKHSKENIDDFMVNTVGIASDVVCGAINITEGMLCEGVDFAADITKRGVGVASGLSRSIIKTFTFGYSKNRRKYPIFNRDGAKDE